MLPGEAAPVPLSWPPGPVRGFILGQQERRIPCCLAPLKAQTINRRLQEMR